MPLKYPAVRKDLEYHEREVDGEPVVLVRDPISNVFYNFNPLQAAMLRALDGKRSYHEIAEALSNEFEVEIPEQAAEQFVATAKERLLLEISSYGVTPEKARKEVERALKRHGFNLRGMGAADNAASRRAVSPEAVLFTAAIRHLKRGEPAKATDYLTAVLEHDPKNARARELMQLIQQAYVRAAGGMTEWPTYPLFDPHRVLRRLDAWVGRLAFSWTGVVLMLALLALAGYCTLQISFDHFHVGVLEIAITFVMFTLLGFLHELGHALACRHYGGEVNEVGMQLMYYLQPVFYCDTSSSYLFENKAEKMIVQLAGTVVTLLCCAALVITLAILNPDVAVYNGLALSLFLASGVLALNLIPFIKLDGYYLLCDLLGQTNLRDRAFRFTKAWLSRRALGLEVDELETSSRNRKILLVFAVSSFAFTCIYIYSLYFRMFAPIVEHAGLAGFVLVVILTFFLLRKRFLRQLWHLVLLIIRERRQIFTWRRTLAFVAVGASAIAPWWLIRWPVLVDTEFVLVPVQRLDVRAQATGTIDEILVREGDHVKAGQPVARLGNPELAAREAELNAELEAMDDRLAELRAGARAEDVALARARLRVAGAKHASEQMKAQLAHKLGAAGLGTMASAQEAAQAAAATGADEVIASRNVALIQAGTRPEEIAAAKAQRAELVAELDSVHGDLQRLVLRSPCDGVVVTSHLRDKLHTLLKPGDLFAQVHDMTRFVAEISMPPWAPMHDYQVGDRVALRLYGLPDRPLDGTIAHIRNAAEAGGVGTDDTLVVVSQPFAIAGGISGMRGHARLYGQEHSLAYALFYLPLKRVIQFRLWSKL